MSVKKARKRPDARAQHYLLGSGARDAPTTDHGSKPRQRASCLHLGSHAVLKGEGDSRRRHGVHPPSPWHCRDDRPKSKQKLLRGDCSRLLERNLDCGCAIRSGRVHQVVGAACSCQLAVELADPAARGRRGAQALAQRVAQRHLESTSAVQVYVTRRRSSPSAPRRHGATPGTGPAPPRPGDIVRERGERDACRRPVARPVEPVVVPFTISPASDPFAQAGGERGHGEDVEQLAAGPHHPRAAHTGNAEAEMQSCGVVPGRADADRPTDAGATAS